MSSAAKITKAKQPPKSAKGLKSSKSSASSSANRGKDAETQAPELLDWSEIAPGLFGLQYDNHPCVIVQISMKSCPPCVVWANELQAAQLRFPTFVFGKFIAKSNPGLLQRLQEFDKNDAKSNAEPTFEVDGYPTIIVLSRGKFKAFCPAAVIEGGGQNVGLTRAERLDKWLSNLKL